MKILAKWVTGSKLYGTSTIHSDTDYHGIFKSSLSSIILGKDSKEIKETTGNDASKNTSDDVDTTLKELRTFIKDAMSGQSYALEGLFIPKPFLLESSPEYGFLVQNRDKLIGDLRPILSYCKNQARIYSQKGDSLKYLEELRQFLSRQYFKDEPIFLSLNRLPSNEYCFIEKGEKEDYYRIGNKRYQLTLSIDNLRKVVEKKISDYGARAKGIKSFDGKAYSHAFRLAYQYQRLVKTGELIFPVPEKEFLLKVKQEEFDKDFVCSELENLITEVLEYPSSIGKPDKTFWENWILSIYG